MFMLYSYIVLKMSLFLLIPLSLCLISMTATFFSIAFSKQIGTVRSIYINSLFICRCYEICFLNCKDVHKTSCGAIATESSSVQLLRTPRSQVRLRRARSDCETKRYDYDSHTVHRLLPLKIPQPHQATKQAQNHEITCRNKTLSRGTKRSIVIRHAGRIIRGKLFSHKISARRLRP